MKIHVKKVNNLVLPTKANPDDAAYDIFATSEPIIVGTKFERYLDGINAWSKIDYIEYKTSLFFAPQDEITPARGVAPKKILKYHIEGLPRSSISKKNLLLANSEATIDNAYRGEVSLRFKYVFQPEDLLIVPEAGRSRIYGVLSPASIYAKGDRIAQIKACANIDIEFVLADELDTTVRGQGGFGSTN